MPGNEFEDGIHNLYQLDNSSQGQYLSQAVSGSWPVLNYSKWVGKSAQIKTPPSFNLNNYNLQHSDSGREHDLLNSNYSQFTPRPEYSRSLTLNNPLNANELLLESQTFQFKQNQPAIFGESPCYDQRLLTSKSFPILKSQHENECADSPTLTTNSERSEITEASSDFSIFRGHQQFGREQEQSAPQIQPMQQPGYNDMQLLQQHLMLNKMQEYQRQQQLQQLGDLRQQNSLNQFSALSRQASGGQFSPLINGMPVHDAPQMLRNWMQWGAAPAGQGVQNKVVFSQEQGQALRSMGLASQQLDVSLYGTPIANARGSMDQYPHLQGLSHDSINLLAKASGQAQKSLVQSSGFGNPYLGDQPAVPDLVGLSQTAFMSKQELPVKNNFGQVSVQGLHSGAFQGSLQESDAPQGNISAKDYSGRHDQVGWPAMQPVKQIGPSQDLVPLDPMEAKILYNMDDNIWDAFGSRLDSGAGGLGSTLEHQDSSYAFPSIQSGTWSALMQSAVAEASSSDTGLQEEWSGLTFQNTEHSTDNQISNFVDSEKQPTGWVDNNLQSTSSFSSKPFPMITDSSTSSSFPGFQQPGNRLSVERRDNVCQNSSHDSFENYIRLQKSSVDEGPKVQRVDPSNSAWSGQMFGHSQSITQHEKGSSADNKDTKSVAKTQHLLSNGPHVTLDSYEGVNQTHQIQQNNQQRENSNDCSRGSSSHEQEQFKFLGNVSTSATSVDKASFPGFQGSSRAAEEAPSRGDYGSNTSTTFHGSSLPHGSNVSGQTSEQMLELLHKVDQSKNDDRISQLGSIEAGIPGADSRDSSVAQIYAQSFASQGFGLKLAPPSQRLVNSNSFVAAPGSPQNFNSLNSRQVKSELGEKNPAWLTSQFQSPPPSHELAYRAHWDSKSGSVDQTSLSPYMNMTGNAGVPFSTNLTQPRSQFQMHSFSNVPVTSQSLQAALPGATTCVSPFNLAYSQDASQQMHSNSDNNQFTVSDALPKSQPSNLSCVSQQCENSTRPYNVWRNVPTHRQPFGVESPKISNMSSSVDPTNASVTSPSQASQGSHDENSIRGGYKSMEVGGSSSLPDFDHREEHPGKEMMQQEIVSKVLDTSRSGGASQGKEQVSDATAQASSERNLESTSHSHDNPLNYSLLNQVQAMNNGPNSALDVQRASGLGGKQLHNNISGFPMDGGSSSMSQPDSFPRRDGETLSSPAQARVGLTAKAPSLPDLQSRPPQEFARSGYSDSHPQSSSSNLQPGLTEHGQVNLQMAQNWFKQYRNGQMATMLDPRLAAAAALHLSQAKPSQNLHINSTLQRLDAGQGGRIWPNTAAALVASQQSSSSYMWPSEVPNQVAIVRPHKRKFMAFDVLPWHKETTQAYQRVQNISLSEQDWAQATNRLIEKVGDEVIGDLHPIHRSKRRLVLTTQLLQQLFHPAPYSVLSADPASNCGIISYFISRLSLGDACSLSNCTRNDFLKPVDDANMDPEKLKTSERSYNQQILEAVEQFIDRAKNLDSEFQRLDKTTSIADLRADFQELERFAVINRFAKFHVRGQSDASGTSSVSTASKSVPQRHAIALPMPRNMPEGVQCLSL